MNNLAITVGTGLKRPAGTYTRVPPPPVDGLAAMLSARPQLEEDWWSPHLWQDNVRKSTGWLASSGVAVDIDYEADGEPFAEHRDALVELANSGKLPGNLFHLTPHGARAIALFDYPCSEKLEVLKAAHGFASLIARAISGSGYKVDEACHKDLARLFFTPNSIAKGVKRRATVITMRGEPYSVGELDVAEIPPPAKPAPVRRIYSAAKTFDEAAAEWNYDHRRVYPRYAAECPVCHDKGSFGHLPDDETRWYCFSTDHPVVGVRGEKGYHGDALDLECFERGLKRVDVLRRDGYLEEPSYIATPTKAQSDHLQANKIKDVEEKTPAQAITRPDWETPIPFDEFDLPVFPTRALPDWLRNFVEAEAEATQTPVDLASMLALSVCAAGMAKKFVVEGLPGWHEPVNLYTVTALPPASRKTAVFSDLVAPISAFERDENERTKTQVLVAAQQKRMKEKRLTQLEDRAIKTNNKHDADLLAMEMRDLLEQIQEMKTPAPPRFIADDITPEKLAVLMSEQMGRIAILSDEGGPFEMMAGRYTDKPNFEVYLKGHPGTDIRVDRKNGTSIHIRKPAITVGLAVQPDVLTGLASTPELRRRGMLARILWCLPRSNIGTREQCPNAVPDSVRAAYSTRIRTLFELAPKRDASGEWIPAVLKFSPSAQEIFNAFRRNLEPKLSEFGELGYLQDWAGKLAGAILRIVGILSINNTFSNPSIYMGESSITAALDIGEFLIAHAKAAFSCMGADERSDTAKHVLGYITRAGWKEFSRRDLHQVARGDARFKNPDSLDDPLSILEKRYFIRAIENEKHGKGRAPSTRYRFHSQNPPNTQKPESK